MDFDGDWLWTVPARGGELGHVGTFAGKWPRVDAGKWRSLEDRLRIWARIITSVQRRHMPRLVMWKATGTFSATLWRFATGCALPGVLPG